MLVNNNTAVHCLFMLVLTNEEFRCESL